MTLKMPLCTKEDLSEAVRLRKRAQYEEERKGRIFNARQRLFGVSTNYRQESLYSLLHFY